MNKLTIIIDKNILQGSSLQILSTLAQNHSVILPHTLLEECLTTERAPGPKPLLKKAEDLVKAGAFASLSQGRMLEIERTKLQPLQAIIDEVGTEQIRNNSIEDVQVDFQKEAEKCNKAFEPILQYVERLAKAFWKTLSGKDYSADWKQPRDDNDLSKRIEKWRKATDTQMNEWLKVFQPNIHSHITKDWTTWLIFQLLVVYGIEWAFKRNLSGQSFEDFDITNDVYDLNYLSCVLHSDVLLSRDNKLRTFAQVMVPTKLICSEIRDLLVDQIDQ